ncbi:proline rich protein 5MeD [Colletotrichum orchidophilum]|uniref:Proline rich protein 5MeD n=1 Tax=Colletotrichum orchidophilum TaxID=1209926 RepID=A0A1G4BEH4_9PEZI|nr:proline rich protein 5MeD [Colletotrichum orchidophilum]OHE99763.1 proline rich protein 5MeD [Colletotrichum orchidophilum]
MNQKTVVDKYLRGLKLLDIDNFVIVFLLNSVSKPATDPSVTFVYTTIFLTASDSPDSTIIASFGPSGTQAGTIVIGRRAQFVTVTRPYSGTNILNGGATTISIVQPQDEQPGTCIVQLRKLVINFHIRISIDSAQHFQPVFQCQLKQSFKRVLQQLFQHFFEHFFFKQLFFIEPDYQSHNFAVNTIDYFHNLKFLTEQLSRIIKYHDLPGHIAANYHSFFFSVDFGPKYQLERALFLESFQPNSEFKLIDDYKCLAYADIIKPYDRPGQLATNYL